jgi:Flp pilus assembly secretin CpaC
MKNAIWWVLLAVFAASVQAQTDRLPTEVSLAVGESRLIAVELRRAALGSGKVVALATPEKGQLLLFGEAPGHTTAQLWLRDGTQHVMRITVAERDLAGRLQQVRGLLDGAEGVTARIAGGHVLLEGARANTQDRQRASDVAALFPGEVLDFVGTSGWESMVQMDVRLIEVRRDQLRQLGLRWDTGASGPGVSITGGGGAGGLSASAAISSVLQSRLDLLQQRGLAYVVAEPTLSCRSGGSARFVSGGEIPLPVTDGLGSTNIQYKEYGVILEVRPRADRSGAIYAEVDVELSQVDSSVRAGDYPAFVKRRTSTAINAQSGETIAIAGLVAQERGRDRQGIPGLSAIPGAGRLFSSERRQERQTELLVLITPHQFESGLKDGNAAVTGQGELIQRSHAYEQAGVKP